MAPFCDHTLPQLKASCARDLGRPVPIHPAQPNTQPFDLAPAVVDQVQPRLPGIIQNSEFVKLEREFQILNSRFRIPGGLA